METLQNAPARHGQAATKHPLVSVVMPAYNAEKYIGEAIRSVQSQTYANWILLVIDDCSTDHTADVVRAFVNTDDRIRLFQNTHNLGAAKTRNRGFELAKGEWVALLDSDDVWHSDKLERQLAAALNSGSEIVYCSYSLISHDGQKISDYIVPEQTSLAMKRKTMRQNLKNKSGIIASNRKRLLNNETPFAIREAYVKLRTGLMFCMTKDKDRACKTIAVTSANPSEGKSLTAANIAISYAMLGKKTLLIDADLRKPTQRRLWKLDVSAGLCDFIAGICRLELVKVKELPLWIVGAGTIPPNPSELLSSDRMKSFVTDISKRYDYVIIDTPPINTVADAQILSAFVDGVLIVAKSASTTADELRAAVDAVERAEGNLCGVVLNDLNMKSVRYSYKYKYGGKYGYKYGSKYGYKYSNADPYERR